MNKTESQAAAPEVAKLTAHSLRQYTKRGATGDAKLVFVYAVTGNPIGLAEYEKSKGTNFRKEEDGTPLYFTDRYVGKKCAMRKTSKGEFVMDTTEIDQLASLSNQYGIDVALRVAGKQTEVHPE